MLQTLESVLVDALLDTLRMIPVLFAVYAVFEIVEALWQEKIIRIMTRAGRAGPVIAAVGGSLPQCGFSVMTSALYTRCLLTMGTLVAAFLSTSDEAIPILLSQHGSEKTVGILVVTKISLAVISGYLVDAVMARENERRRLQCVDQAAANEAAERAGELNSPCDDTRASCEHAKGATVAWMVVLRAALQRTLHIAGFLFAASAVIGGLIAWVGESGLERLLLGHSLLQPTLAALIGLIPNCAASVAITRLYLDGVLSFGSTIAGLSAAAGLGLLVLIRENRDRANTFKVVVWLLGLSIIAGTLLQVFTK